MASGVLVGLKVVIGLITGVMVIMIVIGIFRPEWLFTIGKLLIIKSVAIILLTMLYHGAKYFISRRQRG